MRDYLKSKHIYLNFYIQAYRFLLVICFNLFLDLRSKLGSAKTYDQHLEVVIELKNKRIDIPKEDKLGWYKRY